MKFSSVERLETTAPESTMAVSHDATTAFTGDDQAVVMQTALVNANQLQRPRVNRGSHPF